MRNRLRTIIVTLLLVSSHLAQARQPNPLMKVQKKPIEPKEGTVNWHYGGKVTELTKNSITIQWAGEKPKKFAVSDTLAAGKVPKNPRLQPGQVQGYHVSTWEMYRLTDVKVRDSVMIKYARLGGVDICDHICITKRPGGQVPPLPDEAEWLASIEGSLPAKTRANLSALTLARIRERDAKRLRYHERMNAYWNLEDKGIPYPEKFGEKRRWPAAPMPREVK
jgi:hypothetical protein